VHLIDPAVTEATFWRGRGGKLVVSCEAVITPLLGDTALSAWWSLVRSRAACADLAYPRLASERNVPGSALAVCDER